MRPSFFTKTRPSCTWNVGPLHCTTMNRMITDQGDHCDEDDNSDQGTADDQGPKASVAKRTGHQNKTPCPAKSRRRTPPLGE